ncbi:MAG: Wzz/FepE/Etk N-terminal domain-containing protein [Burkholderiaceae bacterium]
MNTDIPSAHTAAPGDELGLLDLAVPLARHRRLLVAGPFLVALATLAITFVIHPTFTSHSTFIPPQQQQSSAASALSSLGALSGLVGMTAGLKNSADQYVALLQSDAVSDRIIDHFDLRKVYDVKYRMDARKELDRNVRIVAGKKDGLITIEVDDEDPRRAADMANQYVDELRRLTGELALSEAQQRRQFFEAQLNQTRERLARAQQALQASGISSETLKAEPLSATEAVARLEAQKTAAEVRLEALRNTLSDSTPEVQEQLAVLQALRGQLARSEATAQTGATTDYISKYRDFKYQEALFDLFAKQFEMAKLDESRDGGLIQVVDKAQPAERKSRPRRALLTIVSGIVAFAVLLAFVLTRENWRRAATSPGNAARLDELRRELKGG